MGILNLTTGIVFIKNGSSVLAGNGTVALPSLAFTSEPSTGFLWRTTGAMGVSVSGARTFEFASATLRAGSAGVFSFASTVDAGGAGADTGISRSAAATIAIGNGTQGDVSGTVNATIFKSGATAGVTTFGPAAVASITVKGGIITAIS